MLKFERNSNAESNMKSTNSEYGFFYSSTFVFLLWSLLAGALLSDEYWYIGLIFTSLDIVIIYLYT